MELNVSHILRIISCLGTCAASLELKFFHILAQQYETELELLVYKSNLKPTPNVKYVCKMLVLPHLEQCPARLMFLLVFA